MVSNAIPSKILRVSSAAKSLRHQRNRKKYPKIHMEAQKSPDIHSSPKKNRIMLKKLPPQISGYMYHRASVIKTVGPSTETNMQTHGAKQKTQTREHAISSIAYLMMMSKINPRERTSHGSVQLTFISLWLFGRPFTQFPN